MIQLSRADSKNFVAMPDKASKIDSEPRFFRMFDFCLESNTDLYGLAVTGPGKADLVITVHEGEPVCEAGFEWFHEWLASDGELVIIGARRGSEYLLRFPGLADFTFQASGHVIDVFPQSGCEPHTLTHLLLDQVIPRFISQQGRLILHASCVELAPGKAVAFLGNTGMGKSTLASSFWQAGFPLITDDCLLLEKFGQSYFCLAGYSSLRLWPDAVEGLFPTGQSFQSVAQYSDKKQVPLEPQLAQEMPQASQLLGLFILKGWQDTNDSAAAKVTPAKGADSAIDVIDSMFTLDVDCPATIRRNFELAGQVLSGNLPIFRLEYPRHFEKLPHVRELVLDTVLNNEIEM